MKKKPSKKTSISTVLKKLERIKKGKTTGAIYKTIPILEKRD